MNKKKTMALLQKVQAEVDKEISSCAQGVSGGGIYARGLASEGYAGGYKDAISDVMLALNGVWPNSRYHFWDSVKDQFEQ